LLKPAEIIFKTQTIQQLFFIYNTTPLRSFNKFIERVHSRQTPQPTGVTISMKNTVNSCFKFTRA
jgi:hypothetical protein